MRLRMQSLLVLVLVLFAAMPLMAADVAPVQPAQKSFKGLYWEAKGDMQLLFGAVANRNSDGRRDGNWVPLGLGMWLAGCHNDRVLLGNMSVNLVALNNAGNGEPKAALGFTVAPIGFCIGDKRMFDFNCRKIGKDDALWYLKPTYTYLVGLNGRIAHQSSFGLQMSFAWK